MKPKVKSVLSWGKTLTKQTVRKDSLKKLFYFINHPKINFDHLGYWVWKSEVKTGFSTKSGKLILSSSLPPISLINGFENNNSMFNYETGRLRKVLVLTMDDFEKIKQFWINNYADSNLCTAIKKIIDLAKKNRDITIYDQFQNLISTNLVAFYNELSEVKQTYLAFWLNFIFNTTKVSFCADRHFDFKTKTSLKIQSKKPFGLTNWRKLRNLCIHRTKFEEDKWEFCKFSSSKSNFWLNLRSKDNKTTKYVLEFNWKNFNQFRSHFLECMKSQLESKN